MATIDEALKIIYSNQSDFGSYILPIESALGFVSYEKIVATYPNPRFNNSAMDGYGVKLEDSSKCVKIIESIYAGDDKDCTIKSGEAIKITTGARVPKSIEAIIPQEDTISCEDGVVLPNSIKLNSHIRFVGEDINIGDLVIDKNQNITSSHISLLASQGVSHIKVYKKPKVAIFATGEELKLHFESIKPHQIYNSNAPHFYSRAKEMGCEVEFVSLIGDNLEDIKRGIKASLHADLIITTGGVSVGEKDFVKDAFLELGGRFLFEKIDIKPGKPTVFGVVDKSLFLSLPGNPLAASSIFEIFGTAIIRVLKSSDSLYHGVIKSRLKQTLNIKKGRATLIPGMFDGEYFTPSDKRAPGMVNVLKDCNGFILVSSTVDNIQKDKSVNFIPFNFEFSSKIEQNIYPGNS